MWSLPPLPKGRTFIEMRPRMSSLASTCSIGSSGSSPHQNFPEGEPPLHNKWDIRALPWKRGSATVSPRPASKPEPSPRSTMTSSRPKTLIRRESAPPDVSDQLGPTITFRKAADLDEVNLGSGSASCPTVPYMEYDDDGGHSHDSSDYATAPPCSSEDDDQLEPCYATNSEMSDRRTVRFSDEIKIHHISMAPEAVRTRTLSDEVKRRIYYGQKFSMLFEDDDDDDDLLEGVDMEEMNDNEDLRGESLLRKESSDISLGLGPKSELPPLPPPSLWSNFFGTCTSRDMCA